MVKISINSGENTMQASVYLEDEFIDIPEDANGHFFTPNDPFWGMIKDIIPDGQSRIFVLIHDQEPQDD